MTFNKVIDWAADHIGLVMIGVIVANMVLLYGIALFIWKLVEMATGK
jgi:hypothetical protein